MNGVCCQNRSSDDASSPAFVRDGLYMFNDFPGIAVDRGQIVGIAPLTCDGGNIRFTKTGRRFSQRVENPRQIEGCAANDFEHIGGGGLFVPWLAPLVEESSILYGNDCLGGEVRDQLYLLVRERPHLLPVDDDSSD